jgi:hypothetical protein
MIDVRDDREVADASWIHLCVQNNKTGAKSHPSLRMCLEFRLQAAAA